MAISLDDLANLSVNSVPETPALDPDRVISAIFKVRKPGYVPYGVQLRARIDDEMFTGSVRARRLKSLAKDKKILSVALAEPLQIVK
jgi:hypothetical protein